MKATEKIFLTAIKLALSIIILEITLMFGHLASSAKAQNNVSPSPVSAESIDAAKNLFNQGKSKLKQENYRDAIADFSKAIQLNPYQADFYYERGLILNKLGDKEGALRDLDNAILHNPSYAQAYLQRAGMSFYIGSNRRITDSRGIDFRSVDYRARNSQAMLDLRTARDLFAQQGNQNGYQTANQLIQHFAGSLE